MPASFENAWNDEYAVLVEHVGRLHIGEDGESVVIETTASAGSDEGDVATNICRGNFVEQFSCMGELAAGCVQGYEIGCDEGEASETGGD